MTKYVTNKTESLRIEKTYNSVPVQLTNEAQKFQYAKIDNNARKRDYETALDWLLASRILLNSYKVKLPQIPLKGFVDTSSFKLFMSDTGLLINMLGIRFSDILTDNLGTYKGAIAENFVANEFVSNGIPLYYWTSNNRAEVDFLLYNQDGIIPVEVKAANNTKSKSLKIYISEFTPKYSIRISTKNFGLKNDIFSIPLYAVFCLKSNEF